MKSRGILLLLALLAMVGAACAPAAPEATPGPTSAIMVQTPEVNPKVPDEFPWSPEQQRQRELAIEKRDRSLLPECTEEYYAWRDLAQGRGLLHDQPPSLDFWENPGCRGTPDEVVPGPASGPGPSRPNATPDTRPGSTPSEDDVEPTATFDLSAAIERRCQESKSWDQPKPGYQWIDQAEEHNNITIRLLQGKFSGASTLLEFLVEYPMEEEQPDYSGRFRFMGHEVEGISAPSAAHFTSTWGCGGRERHVLEGLGAVDDPEQGLTIVLPRVIRRTGPPPGTPGPTQGWETLEGTWTFQVAPVELIGQARTINIDQSLEQGGITLELERVVLGSDETLVYYHQTLAPLAQAEQLGPPRIRYDGDDWLKGEGGGSPSREGEPRVLRFPLPPSEMSGFELDFRSFIASVETELDFTFQLQTEKSESMVLEQKIHTPEGVFRAVSMSLEGAGESASFDVTLEHLDEAARNVFLRPRGDWRGVYAATDRGNSYIYGGGSTSIVDEGKRLALGESTVSFQGPLDPEATELTIHFPSIWKIQPGPWAFYVDIPQEGGQ